MEIVLKGHDVELRPYTSEHIAQTVEWLKTEFIQRNFGQIKDITIEKHKKWLSDNVSALKWAIYANQYVGNIFLFRDLRHHSGYLQIYLGNEQHVGKGIGRKTMQLMINYSFEELKLHRLWLHCYPENAAASALYRKMGFHLEGSEREVIYRDGKFISQDRWSLLVSDWMKSKNIV